MQDSDARLYTQKPLAWTNDGFEVLGITITHRSDLLERNYNPMIAKYRAILKSWQTRNLSLLGKICVINTLVSSLFVHKLTALPNLAKEYIQQLEGDFSAFIWNGSKAKIPLKTLQLNKKQGGLNLVKHGLEADCFEMLVGAIY